MQNLAMIAESTLAQIHENITTRMLLNKLLTEGYVSIDDAHMINKLVHKVINESSDLFIPDSKQIEKTIAHLINESEGKVLVDPETGDQFIYDPTTGELLPASPAADAGMDTEDDVPAEDDADMDEDIPAEGDEDVSANEVKTESTSLNENEELILNLINKIKEV